MKIKKLLLLSAFAVASALQLSAQEQKEEFKFLPHWYIQLQGGVSHTLGEAKFSDLLSPAAQIGVGRQFNPYIGARIKVNGWQAKGGWVTPAQTYKFNQLGLETDVRLDLTNLIGGYKPKRLVSIGMFAGVGANMAWGNDEAQNLSIKGYQLEYLWDDSKCNFVGNGGLDVNFRLSDRVSLGLEANAHVLSDRFNSKKAGNADWHFNGLVGLRINLGKTYEKIEIPVRQIVAVAEPEPVAETQPVVEAKPQVEPQPVEKKVEECRRDVFFELNKYDIRESEQQKMADIAAFLQQNPQAKVMVTGYADAVTGNDAINDRLAAQRADVVAKALCERYGIAADRVLSDSKGSREQPFKDNEKNRVSICIAK